MAADALAPHFTKTSAAMVLALWDKLSFIFHDKDVYLHTASLL